MTRPRKKDRHYPPCVYRRGKAPDYRTVRDQWDKACADAGVEDADLRDLGTMAGTAAKAQGKSPTALLWHTSPAMTAR